MHLAQLARRLVQGAGPAARAVQCAGRCKVQGAGRSGAQGCAGCRAQGGAGQKAVQGVGRKAVHAPPRDMHAQDPMWDHGITDKFTGQCDIPTWIDCEQGGPHWFGSEI